MTNLKKFIEVMNKTFNDRFKPGNLILECIPCGALKKPGFACDHFKCDSYKRWWQKEYHPIGIVADELNVMAFALWYTTPQRIYAPSIFCDYI